MEEHKENMQCEKKNEKQKTTFMINSEKNTKFTKHYN